MQSFELKFFIKFFTIRHALSSVLKLLAKRVENNQSGIVYLGIAIELLYSSDGLLLLHGLQKDLDSTLSGCRLTNFYTQQSKW